MKFPPITKRAVVYLILEIIRQMIFIGGVIWSGFYTLNLMSQISAPEDKLLVFITLSMGYIIIFSMYLLTGMPFVKWVERMKEMIDVR